MRLRIPIAAATLAPLAAVVRGGRPYTRQALDAPVARDQAHFGSRPHEAIVHPIVRRVLARARK